MRAPHDVAAQRRRLEDAVAARHDTSFPYGVEVFTHPIGRHLSLAPGGPEGWEVTGHPLWGARTDPVRAAHLHWTHLHVGPALRPLDGVVGGEASRRCTGPAMGFAPGTPAAPRAHLGSRHRVPTGDPKRQGAP